VHLTRRIATADKETLDGLRRAGFQLDFGPDGAGIARAYFTRGGGYYIDVGCSQLIIDGKIKVKHSPQGITRFGPHELVLADGETLDADIVVLATGYDNMRTTVRKVLGDKVADRCKDVWDLDEEGELNAVSFLPPLLLESLLKVFSLDVASQRSPWFLVHGRQSRSVPYLLEVSGASDQGCGGGVDLTVVAESYVLRFSNIDLMHPEGTSCELFKGLF
jgi:hypothetical protein